MTEESVSCSRLSAMLVGTQQCALESKSQYDDTSDWGDNVDMALFDQILDMDDDEDDRTFTKGLVFGFLEQAEQTFDKMDAAVKSKDLPELSTLGHFLKGSSATLGFSKIRDKCERIQHFGAKKDETGIVDIKDEAYCLTMIEEALTEAKKALNEVSGLMKKYFADP